MDALARNYKSGLVRMVICGISGNRLRAFPADSLPGFRAAEICLCGSPDRLDDFKERGHSDQAPRRSEQILHCKAGGRARARSGHGGMPRPGAGSAEHFADGGAGDFARARLDREEAAVCGDEGVEGLAGAASDLGIFDIREKVHSVSCLSVETPCPERSGTCRMRGRDAADGRLRFPDAEKDEGRPGFHRNSRDAAGASTPYRKRNGPVQASLLSPAPA